MVSEYLVSVVDSEDGAKGEAKAACGLCPQLGCRGRAPAGGLGVRPPRSWSINAFCVTVKPFS